MFFVVGLLILFYLRIIINNIFYIWILIESVFFFVIFSLIKSSRGKVNLNRIIFYLFIQALGRVLLLSSMLVEIFYFRNYYYLSSNVCLGCLYLRIVGVLLKIGMFPFYLQVYQIINFINFRQILLFMLFPKIVPAIILYSMLGQLELGRRRLAFPFLVVFVSGIQGIKSSDLRELLAWSRLGQLRWIFVSIIRSFSSFIFFFFIYAFILIYTCFLVDRRRSKLFYDFSNVRRSLERYYSVLFLVFFISGLAPFLMFYLKLFLFFIIGNFSIGFLILMLVGSMGIFLFYIRVLQVLVCVGNSFFYHLPFREVSLRRYFRFLRFFFFCFGRLLFLI